MRKSTKFAVGTAVAAGIGYLAGILTAPKSGKETRQDIQTKAVEVKRETERRLKDLNNELSNLITAAKTKLKGLESGAKEEFEKAIEKAQKAREKGREMLSAVHEGESQDKDLKKAVDDVNKAIEHLKKYLNK